MFIFFEQICAVVFIESVGRRAGQSFAVPPTATLYFKFVVNIRFVSFCFDLMSFFVDF